MNGPWWLDGLFALLLGLVAARHAMRLIVARSAPDGAREKSSGDGAHLIMALGMIAMFVPAVDRLPRVVWIGTFVVLGAWLGATLLRAGSAGERVPHRGQRVHLLLSTLAMGYMFAAMTPGEPAPGTAFALPASGAQVLAHEHGGGAANLTAVTIALALYFLVHAVWSGARALRTRGDARMTDAGHVVMGLAMSYMFVAMLG